MAKNAGVQPFEEYFEVRPQYLFRWDASEEAYLLLYPEGIVKLNPTAAEILKRCTGDTSVGELIEELTQMFPDADADVLETSVHTFLEAANAKGWIRSKA